jgi:cephalosporin-C deacetylase-like acetyl esterase
MQRVNYLSSATWIIAAAWLAAVPALAAEPADGDAVLAEYFRRQTAAVGDACLADVATLEAWQARRGPARGELLEMLGLDPLPEKTPLAAIVTGTVEHEAFTVENLHFQSRPGLYVTANLYLPRDRARPAPAILYACGHAPEKIDGASLGNKTHYRHHGEWFARHGYVCLVFDTLQLGEIEGFHHGTYNLDRWWWVSRGYTPAGVEAWNGIRAIDYLQSRPEVDPDRIGMTGRSGGGVGTWWTAALDERVKVAVPVAGITDLRDQVVDGCVRGHCDCMFMVNTFHWDYPAIAALIAPRPLLVGNTDADWIFPLDGVVRTFEQARRIYTLYGAEKDIGLAIAPGPHEDGQELQLAALRWFDKHLRKEVRPIESSARATLPREKLRVFARLPADEVNTRVDETFVAAAPQPPPPAADAWPVQRDEWLAALRDRTFRGWPAGDEPLDVARAWFAERDGVAVTAYDFTSQAPFRLRLHVARRADLAKPARVDVRVLDADGWLGFLTEFGGPFAAELGLPAVNADERLWPPVRQALLAGDAAVVFVCPRGVGLTAWDSDPKRRNQIRRRFYLLGQTLEGMQVYDVRRAMQAVRGLPDLADADLWLEGSGTTGALALYAALFEPGVAGLELADLPRSHRDGPTLLGVQRALDIPQTVALAAERSPVVLHRPAGGADAWAWPRAVAAALGWPADRVQIDTD